MSGQQQLPMKEANLFRQIIVRAAAVTAWRRTPWGHALICARAVGGRAGRQKFYENKQYKKGIKAADAILKKFPDHGGTAQSPRPRVLVLRAQPMGTAARGWGAGSPETLAMKGLILNFQDKKEEAYELVRRGLKCDLKSHVCTCASGVGIRLVRAVNPLNWVSGLRWGLRFAVQPGTCTASSTGRTATMRRPSSATGTPSASTRCEAGTGSRLGSSPGLTWRLVATWVMGCRLQNNNQILRDLALLEMQIRNFDALIVRLQPHGAAALPLASDGTAPRSLCVRCRRARQDTRLILLEQRANQRVSWIGMAVAHHVAGNLQLAIDVLDAHESSIEVRPRAPLAAAVDVPVAEPRPRPGGAPGVTVPQHNEESRYDYELSELYLYKAQLYEEAGRFQEAYDYLEAKKRHIFDDEALQERQGAAVSVTSPGHVRGVAMLTRAAAVHVPARRTGASRPADQARPPRRCGKNPAPAAGREPGQRRVLHPPRRVPADRPRYAARFAVAQCATCHQAHAAPGSLGSGDGPPPGDSAKLIELYSELSALYPRAHVPKRALLDLLEGATRPSRGPRGRLELTPATTATDRAGRACGRRRCVPRARGQIFAQLAEQGCAVAVHDGAQAVRRPGQGRRPSLAAGRLPRQPTRQAEPVRQQRCDAGAVRGAGRSPPPWALIARAPDAP